ncbi:acetyl/propionyl/methylcrotonyl-CoA carboxylase subunit alpha [Actinocorallia populi]|uniref:acetyl/propionyl/methylcrotonyl-CoA carboxylase subunit alpha n=1 Tax=Actinocorallia populi TaxID=2079200 RepID=UPI000D0918DA|nr:biotin carboxylase N-terminal domain-containing protein [Actinocorallia populi]
MTITRLLVANRGEIARRVFRTCRTLGIRTVAVHSDADAAMPFAAEADLAVLLPGDAPSETYLDADRVLAAAVSSGADAVHPGYGFLSENADFARAVIKSGLVWIGPTPQAMDAMATKVEAKRLMHAAGVPVLAELDPSAITEADLPVLVKASSGGGGRGMRVVRTMAGLAESVRLASSEAAGAFGDPTVFCEPYVERGRHVEVQILGDTHGTVVVLGDRDCSLQRRHQKVVEEAPAPGLADTVRAALHEAARTAGEAIGYVGAGTVEFLLDGDRFFFLEMNTRLQVEHPVTECVTGLDLVALQIAVAEGAALGGLLPANTSEPRGHAVEVRLYAEDPAQDYQPQSGTLTALDVPGVTACFDNPPAYGLRLDSGVEAGSEIGTFYDAMVAKVVAWAPDREQALRRLAGALERATVHGVHTNRDLLVNLLRDPVFVAGDMHTTYLDGADLGELTRNGYDEQGLRLAGLAAVAADTEARRGRSPVQRGVPAGWRNVVSQPQRTVFDRLTVEWHGGRDGYTSADGAIRVVEVRGTTVVLEHGGVRLPFTVNIRGDRYEVDSVLGHLALVRRPRFTDPAARVAAGSLLAPMPGSVVAVRALAGDTVRAGQVILVLEAMKMQHNVTAPADGVVAAIEVQAGQQVAAGDVLARVEEDA